MTAIKINGQGKNRISFSKKGGNGFDDAALIKLRKISNVDSGSFFEILKSSADGLSEDQVIEKRDQFGLNEIEHEKPPSWYKQLFHSFLTPFNGVLVTIAIVSLIIDVFLVETGSRDYKTVIVVIAMVLLSSLIRFWQEYSGNQAAEKLKSMVKTTATLLRKESGKKEIDIKEIVPGDIILLSAGDMIPADCRIIYSKDLFVSQSILTGEALPVEKR
jgi:Mg2+-importing ATPase